jgi:hypothetical protein
LGITLSEVMQRYFGGADSSDGAASRIVKDVDRLFTEKEEEGWVAKEQRQVEDAMEREHRGEGVDDTF